MSTYYDRHGYPLSTRRLGELLEDREYRRVACTKLPDLDAEVSTVWLGINHRFGDGPPLIFETMVFGGGLDQYQERYSTEQHARAGHDAVVAKVRAEAADFRIIVADPDVRAAVELLEKQLNAHSVEHWGEPGLTNGDLYTRVAKAVAG